MISKKQFKGPGLDGGPKEDKPATATNNALSKLMEMKFMQQGEAKEKLEEEEKEQKKVDDASRWKLDDKLSKKSKKQKASVTNYSDILGETQVAGRRSWGNFNKPKEKEENPEFDMQQDDAPEKSKSKGQKRRSTDGKGPNKKRKKSSH